MPKIVISYRRADDDAIVGRIRDRLASRYGDDSIFMDIDNIPFGVDFRRHIDDVLQTAEVVIAVMGPRWVGPVRGGTARIHDPADPVRIEIETTLKRGVPVVPVLVNGARMAKPADLPEAIRDLSFHNAAQVDSGRDFHQHMDRLIQSLDRSLGGHVGGRKGGSGATGKVRWWPWLAAAGLVVASGGWFVLTSHTERQQPEAPTLSSTGRPPPGGATNLAVEQPASPGMGELPLSPDQLKQVRQLRAMSGTLVVAKGDEKFSLCGESYTFEADPQGTSIWLYPPSKSGTPTLMETVKAIELTKSEPKKISDTCEVTVTGIASAPPATAEMEYRTIVPGH